MARQRKVTWTLAGVLVVQSAALAAPPAMRREARADFAIDDAFQADGGVQLYFELLGPEPQPKAAAAFRALDRSDRLAAIKEPVHVALTRVSYVVEKDATFFTEARLVDLSYMRALAPEMQLSARPDGGFAVGQTPSSNLSLEFHGDSAFAGDALTLARGAPVLVQENADFARVLGWRTGAWSATWTFHEALGPGRTRVTALSMSYLYNLPPGFMGGAERFTRDTVSGSLAVIARLRAYDG